MNSIKWKGLTEWDSIELSILTTRQLTHYVVGRKRFFAGSRTPNT